MIRIGRHVLIPPIPSNPCKYGARTHTKDFKSSPSFSFPKKFKKGRPTSRTPLFSPSLPLLSKRAKSRNCTGRKKQGKGKKRRRGGQSGANFNFQSQEREGAGGRPTDRGGKESRENFPPPPPPLFPATTSQQRKKKFQLAGGPSLQGWRECPGWMEDCCSVFGSKIGGRGGSGLFVWKEENFIPLFSHPLFSSLLDRFQRPSPLLSSKAGRRVSGGRKEPRRRRSSTPPSHFPPPSPKNPYPFVFFPGGRPAPSLPNHPTTASSSTTPSSLLSLSGRSLRGCPASTPLGGGGEIKFSAHLERRRKGQKEMGNKEEKEIEFALKVARDIHLVGANKHSSSPNPNPSSALLS